MTTYKEVHTPLWVDRIVEYDRQLPDDWVCDITALRADRPHPGPSRAAVAEFLRRPETVVVVAVEGTSTVVGYLIADDNSSEYGGHRGRWMGADNPEVIQGLFDAVCDSHGWVWGRITNPKIQEAIRGFGCVPRRDDSQIFTYKRAGP
jgi:hypothetical protein